MDEHRMYALPLRWSRRKLLRLTILGGMATLAAACSRALVAEAPGQPGGDGVTPQDEAEVFEIVKTDAEWRRELTEQEYRVLRQHGTESAFTGDLWDNHREGVYICAGCDLALFSSETKFESGTGWPSFYAPIAAEAIGTTIDTSYGVRTEVHCSRCGGHLGHVFKDGPEPTGLRYCINAIALDFEEAS